ncbi:MAG: hypothetical protein ABIR59_01485 [Gemmatimonadales bacterium]
MTASPSHFFDAPGARPGGAASDAAADPWNVRRAENLLTSLEGVLSARVVTTPLGEVSEIHILAHAGQTPKQVVRNVESALLAHLGLKVDHRKISIAQTADVKPIETLDLGAVRDRAAQRMVLFDDLSMATGPRNRRVTATVALTSEGRIESASEEGPDTARNRMDVAARATVAVLERLLDRGGLALEGVQMHEAFGRTWVMVGVQAIGGRESKLLVGTAEVRESAEHAAVYATLDATNRWTMARSPR